MGWDISYHPVDVEFIHKRIIPYVQGDGDIDDLLPDAVRIAKVRFRANAWGLGLLNLTHESDVSVPLFDPEVHVWGRPFFIGGKSTDEVSAAIDNYMSATEDEVDEIARTVLESLDETGGKLVNLVKPSNEGELPNDTELAKGLCWKMDLFRDAFQACGEDRPVQLPGTDEQRNPRELFATDFTLAVLEFASHFRPGWMARGYGWPTNLLCQGDVDVVSLFDTPQQIIAPLLADIPELADTLRDKIEHNFMVGGYVRASAVPELIQAIDDNDAEINLWAKSQNWGDDGAAIYLTGMREAACDAARRGIAFVEAAEVYSAPMGVMN